MQLTSLSLALTRAGLGGFSPSSLFLYGEQGVWYDPSDISRYMGTGPELVTNGTFDTNLSGWTVLSGNVSVWDAGRAYVGGGGGVTGIYAEFPTVVGKTYLVTGVIQYVAGDGARIRVTTGGGFTGPQDSNVITSGTGTAQVYAIATASTMRILLRASGNASSPLSAYYDNVSVRELTALDTATMYQDSAGTTPVTAVEQPVGLILDKSKGLVLGPELVTTPSIDGLPAGGGSRTYSTGATVAAGRWYVIEADVTDYVGTSVVGFSTSGGVFSSVSSISGNGKIRQYRFTGASGTVNMFTTDTNTANFRNISVRELPGNHAYQTTSTSRPVLRQDAGGRYYLSFDGVDDFLVTNSIDFTSTDKMTVFAGVRKLSDAASGVLAELSATSTSNSGVFAVFAPSAAAPDYGWRSHGSLPRGVASATTYTSPLTNVLAGLGDISGDSAILRINGAQVAQLTPDQGTGNYGNYPLYIGRRGGTALPFNGYLYSLIVRGAQTSDTQVSQTETWVNQRTGGY